MNRPESNEYPEFYHSYVERVKEDNLIEALQQSLESLKTFAAEIPQDKYEYKYGDDKWKLKEVFIHLADTERVMQYRALCFSRNDKTNLPGFEEKDYINNCNSDNLTFGEIVEDLKKVRESTISFFSGCTEEMLTRSGVANNGNVKIKQ